MNLIRMALSLHVRLRAQEPSPSTPPAPFTASLAVLALVLGLVCACPVARASAWTQEAYVWQRSPLPVLALAAQEGARLGAEPDGVALLAAEVSWRGGRAEPVYSEIDYSSALLRGCGRVALVLRAGPFSGPFDAGAPACVSLRGVLREVLRRARAGGLEPAELQVDFDCAEARLAGYAEWLRALRADCGGLPLHFTALPSWLGRPAMEGLAASADGFVLQVHALEKPSSPGAISPLCEPERALGWVRRAGALGRPFRVALPTYGYLLAFSSEGRLLGFTGGSRLPSWPADALLRELRAAEAALAELARRLRADHPDSCVGLLWFRLPAAGDALNWRWPALAEVLRGGGPAALPRVKCIRKSDTTWELVLSNAGTASCVPPAEFTVSWPAGLRVAGADALGGATLRLVPGTRRALFTLPAREGAPLRLDPGRSLTLGWLRLEGEGSPLVEPAN